MSRLGIVILASVLLGCFVVVAQRIEIPSQPEQESRTIALPSATQTPLAKRQREGTAFKGKYVFFRQTGERFVLYTVEDNQRYTCLENLALERILTASLENPDRQFWKIDGEFTEFRGENFILIRRAVIAQDPASIAPPAPLAP
jgi:hypothetical protein